MRPTKDAIQITSVLCCLALSACQSDNKSPPSAADNISMSVDEKSAIELQAPIEADRYWLSFADVPKGWNIPADIVLVHAGTSDHTADASVVTPLFDEIQDWSTDNQANLQVFVASIVDQRRDNTDRAYLEPFNVGIEALVPSYQPNATFVDQFHALDWQTDITDYQTGITGLHPTPAGYEKMAAKWPSALISAEALNKCP